MASSQRCFENTGSLRSIREDFQDFLGEKIPFESLLAVEVGEDGYPVVSGKLFSKVLLPGKGKKPESCESWTPTFFCPSCGKPHFTNGCCKKSTCPDCEVDWRFDRCESIMERVLSQKIQRKKRCRHFVVSPEVEDYPETIDELKRLRKDVYEFAKSKGVEGGVVIFHPFRILPKKKSELWGEIEKDGNEFKLWKKLLEKDWSELLNYVYFSPHFHILGLGKKGNNTFECAKKSDRFIWKGIGELSSADDIGRCVMYLLSHSGVFEKSHYSSLVWFGSLSSSCWSLKKANMKLRNGSTVREFTLDLVEEFIGNVHEELSGSLECENCGAGLLHISSAPDYFDDDNLEFQAELQAAYEWWRGSIPPPDLSSRSGCWDYLKTLVRRSNLEALRHLAVPGWEIHGVENLG